MVTDTAIFVISGLSAFFDLRIRRIPNWLIALGLFSGVALNAAQGYGYLLASVSGFVVGIAILILPFAMGWMGAGDVKFFGVIGALMGVSLLPRVFFYSALIAGIIALGYTAIGLANLARLKTLWNDTKAAILTFGKILPDPVQIRSHGRASVPWGVAFAIGAIIAYYVDPTGQWAGF